MVFSRNIRVKNNYQSRLITVISRISGYIHWLGLGRNICVENHYQSRLITMSSRTAGYIHGLVLGRAHAQLDCVRHLLHPRDTPQNNTVHTTLQNPLQSHRNTSTTQKTHTDNPPFPLIRLSLVIAVAAILLTIFPIETSTTKRGTSLTQRTNLPPLTYSGEAKKRPRPPATQPSTPDLTQKNIPSSSATDKSKKKRQKRQSRDKKDVVNAGKKAKKQKIANTSHQKNTFCCYTISIQGLTKRKWTALLVHPAAQDPDAIIITEHHLPFTHTPSYVKHTGWVFHTIQSPFKKHKQGLSTTTSSGRGGVLLPSNKTHSQLHKKHNMNRTNTR